MVIKIIERRMLGFIGRRGIYIWNRGTIPFKQKNSKVIILKKEFK